MQNLSDKELDELMKKANESQSYSYDADSWTALSDKLDKTPKRGFAGGQITLLIVIAGLVLMSVLYFTVSDKTSESSHAEASFVVEKKQEQGVNTAETKTVGETSAVASESDAHSDKVLAPTKNQENNPNAHQANIQSEAAIIDVDVIERTREVESSTTFPEEEQRASPTVAKQAPAMERSSVPAIAMVQGSLAPQELNIHLKNTASDEVTVHTNDQAKANTESSNALGLTGILAADGSVETLEKENNKFSPQEEQQISFLSTKPVSAKSLEEATIDSVATDKKEVMEEKSELNVKDSIEKKQDEVSRTSRFAVKLSVSPDFSSENFSKADAIGWNYGASIEYQISKTFAVSAGLLNTRKYYTAEDVTYGQYTAEFAEGDCRMWDIPVNVHYYIPSKQSLQLIGSVGFSSYIMKQENYTYYPDETNKDRKYYSEINNENSEWFKILNLSIAAQLQVSPVLFLQIEPFIKVPLTGLGEGDISLSSVGTFFTVKYQLFTKNPRNNALKK